MTGALSLEFSRSTYIYMRVTWLNTVCISYQSSKVNSTPGYNSSKSSNGKFIKSPASGSSDLIYNNWKSNKNDL